MVVLLGGLFGYKTFYSNPDNIVKFSTYGGNDTKDVEKTISKQSILGKKLPYAEEIIAEINNQEDIDSELYDIVSEKYGDDVAKLFEVGLIPSTLLTESENIQIILSGNVFLKEDSNYYPPQYVINTLEYMTTLGDTIPTLKNNPSSRFNSKIELYNYSNINSKIETGDLDIQGVFLTKPDINNLPNETYLLAYNKFKSELKNMTDGEELINELNKNYILTVNFLVNKNMKVSEVLKEFSDLRLNDGELNLLSFKDLDESNKELLPIDSNVLGYLQESKGDDYEIGSYSILQVKYYTSDSTKIYSNSNYLSLKDKQIELSTGSVEFTNDLLYTDYEF